MPSKKSSNNKPAVTPASPAVVPVVTKPDAVVKPVVWKKTFGVVDFGIGQTRGDEH